MAVAIRGVRAAVPGLAVGNLIGSNITDPLASLGLGASVHSVEVADEVIDFDLPIWGAATLLGLALLASKQGVTRRRGLMLIGVFVGYSAARALIVGS